MSKYFWKNRFPSTSKTSKTNTSKIRLHADTVTKSKFINVNLQLLSHLPPHYQPNIVQRNASPTGRRAITFGPCRLVPGLKGELSRIENENPVALIDEEDNISRSIYDLIFKDEESKTIRQMTYFTRLQFHALHDMYTAKN